MRSCKRFVKKNLKEGDQKFALMLDTNGPNNIYAQKIDWEDYSKKEETKKVSPSKENSKTKEKIYFI